MKTRQIQFLLIATLSLLGMGSTLAQTPNTSSLSTVSRTRPLTEKEALRWAHLDPIKDTIPGMSVDRAYKDLVKKRTG